MSRRRLVLRGTMRAHTDTVTAIAAAPTYNFYNKVISSSRDKSIIVWHLTREDTVYGIPLRRLTGHSDSVEDVVLSSESSNCRFALSGSKDGELRLWDLETGTTVRRFIGHTSEVLSVSISIDDRHIVSASRDNTIKLWNTRGECKYTIEDGDSHSEQVSCVRLSPTTSKPIILSCSWDKSVKIWDLSNCKLRKSVKGHDCHVKSVTISPECSVGASGGDDGLILLWNPCPKADDKYIGSFDAGDVINALCFHPSEYWITVATESSVQIWDLVSKTIIQELTPDLDEEVIYCTSLCWSADGDTLFSGCNNGVIRVYTVCRY